MLYLRIILILIFALSGLVRAEPKDHPASAKLLADVSAIKPGEPFMVGIMLTMQPGWHVYWINPGDSGLPPAVKWDLPEGFEISDLKFPVPKRFDEPGNLVAYGYDNEVLLMAEVTVPADLKVGSTVKIGCDVSWLVCEKVCLPGEAKLSIDLPVSDMATPSNRDAFEAWQQRMPKAASEVGARVSPGGDKQAREHYLIIDWPDAAPARAEWFPPVSDVLTFSDIHVVSEGQHTRVSYKISTLAGKVPPQTIPESLLAYDTPDAKRQGLILAAFEFPRGRVVKKE